MKRIILVIAAAAMLLLPGCRFESQRRITSSPVKDSLLVEYMRYASQFSDCSFVDWEGFSRMRIMQNVADWDESLNGRIHPSWKQESLEAGAWALLQNAKAELHRRSIPVRALSSLALRKRMDELEKSFDKAFETMVTQEYYLRCFEDVFDEIVPPEVEGLYR